MNDKHYPAGSSKGGQFAPKGGSSVGGELKSNILRDFKGDSLGFDMNKQRKMDSFYQKTKLPPLNTYDPKLQQVTLSLFEEASLNEPQITKDVSNLSKIIGGNVVGLENSIKSPESIAHKIKENMEYYGNTYDQAVNWCDDLCRYTVLFEPNELASGTHDFIEGLMSKGYKIKYLQNRYLKSKEGMEQKGYKDIGVKFISPNGQKMEVQFMVPQMYSAKNGLVMDENGNFAKRTDGISSGHDYYDMQKQIKLGNMSAQDKEERLNYLKYMNEVIYNDIGIPQGVEEIRRERYER